MRSLTTGVWPRESRITFLAFQRFTKKNFPSRDTSIPFGPEDSLPGTTFHPSVACHSHTSPVLAGSRAGGGAPTLRRLGLVAANPPPGSGVTELKLAVRGATTQPIQVNVGCVGRVSISKTSIDSRNP